MIPGLADLSALAPFIAALAAAGLIAGLVAGLFGVGGGIVIVPALYTVFGALGTPDETRMHAAVATSLATIVVTSARSVQAHHRRGAVDWIVLRDFAPAIVGGAFVGGLAARLASGEALTVIFGIGALVVALRMGFAGAGRVLAADVPGGAARLGLGGALGFFSSWMGIGGGVFGVAMLTMCSRPIHQAVGTAAGFGALIGLPGAIGFILAGLGVADRPPLSLGYVNGPGFVLIATLTSLTAPLGAAIAHSLSQTVMRRSFAVVLGLIASRMLYSALNGAG